MMEASNGKGVVAMINQVTLVGRLTKDPELRTTTDGTYVAHITLAVNRNFRNHNGEIDTDFVQCTLWRKAAENTHHYCRKGAVIGITGRLQTRNYEGRDGKKVYVTEVVAESVRFLSGRVPESAHATETQQPQTAAQAVTAQAAAIADQAAAMHTGGVTVPPPQGGQAVGGQFMAQAVPAQGATPPSAGQAASQTGPGSSTTQAPSEKRGEVEYAF
jgi:single stranded DNA-binding protein